jgi:hypothetical protein
MMGGRCSTVRKRIESKPRKETKIVKKQHQLLRFNPPKKSARRRETLIANAQRTDLDMA